jgi:alpha-glucosidase (family GH31 glycosyl hydrolase)
LKEKQNLFHFSYFKNSNGMDVFINQTRADPAVVTYKTIGGIIHFRFILGDNNPENLLKKWNTFLGTSAVPPFWSLGFHQCRWGYHKV